MDRRERTGDFLAGLMAAFEGHQSEVWTALPGIVVSFNPAEQSCVIQPALRAKVQNFDNSFEWVTLPLLLDCPVIFPSGGGCSLTFPIFAGDEVLVVFASRCIDSWWQSGGVQVQSEIRMHDLSDGFVIPGPRSKPNVIPSISTDAAQLRSDTGNSMVSVDPAGNLTVSASGTVNLTAANVNITGVLTINGTAFLSHHHSGVQTGGGVTGGVV